MGLFGKRKVSIPAFRVSIYGKLPCHKEYFQAIAHPAFGELRQILDRQFDQLIQSGAPRPYVQPDRRFFTTTSDPKTHLVGLINESDDGLRGFPFVLAMPLPAKFQTKAFPTFWQTLDQIWTYLEAYYANLRTQPDATQVYNRVRDVLHELKPFAPEDWSEPSAEAAEQARGAMDSDGRIDLTTAGDGLLATLTTAPNYLLWPSGAGNVAYIGQKGLGDIVIDQFGGSDV